MFVCLFVCFRFVWFWFCFWVYLFFSFVCLVWFVFLTDDQWEVRCQWLGALLFLCWLGYCWKTARTNWSWLVPHVVIGGTTTWSAKDHRASHCLCSRHHETRTTPITLSCGSTSGYRSYRLSLQFKATSRNGRHDWHVTIQTCVISASCVSHYRSKS